ncbi:helix-turn-helix transcriptional regulator [Desmospora activa]|uniref:Putative DNA-binding transcriptional regulator YafY n=1 Tax=Desmospora activa DSM 45169 TaxID=1121389 RepID=A0A2T4Z8B5_9BACL|nr:YafY family protein [Desmospora activa]PTM58137.1 putative DNA-binding transcriptional regulator YafY [Desmospora activa DSM 45169]
MSKTKRLMELIVAVNRKRQFTVKELAREFGVSPRTILRDLQELSELGVPLYSEVGPHGGYRILKERLLPPIAFTEQEAVAVFFAVQALRHYSSLPFETETSTALNKFYNFVPEDVRDRIDQMRDRVDFVTPVRKTQSPHLSVLLDAAVRQNVLLIDYESRRQRMKREVQPIGIYTRNGLWYCPAYCFLHKCFRLFRCDRIHSVDPSASKPLDLRQVHLGNKELFRPKEDCVYVFAELTEEGVERCEVEPWPVPRLHVRSDGTGWLEGDIAKKDIPFFASFFVGLGKEATVQQPKELRSAIRHLLSELTIRYAD